MKTTEGFILAIGAYLLLSRLSKPAAAFPATDYGPTPIVALTPPGPRFAPILGGKTNPTAATTPAASAGSGFMMCVARDGGGFSWPSNQAGGCPSVDFVEGNVPYIIGDDGTPMPLIY